MLGLQGARFARFKAVFAGEVESCCDYGVIAAWLQRFRVAIAVEWVCRRGCKNNSGCTMIRTA